MQQVAGQVKPEQNRAEIEKMITDRVLQPSDYVILGQSWKCSTSQVLYMENGIKICIPQLQDYPGALNEINMYKSMLT